MRGGYVISMHKPKSKQISAKKYFNSKDISDIECSKISECWLFSDDSDDLNTKVSKKCFNCGIYDKLWY